MGDSKTSVTRSRGRPARSAEDVRDARRRISACALQLFQEDGYDAVSMRRLAKEAGCTVMTLYRYFDRKIDILRDLWSQVFAEVFGQLEPLAEGEPDAHKRLFLVAHCYVDFWLRNREHYFLVFMSAGVSQPDVSVFVDDDGVVERFVLFRRCVEDVLPGAGDSSKADLQTELLLCTLHGIAHNLITISAYPWSDSHKLVGAAVERVTD
ncbi:MAG: TetR/AcrR family transcriptional regulator [Pseudomonadota bacterium]